MKPSKSFALGLILFTLGSVWMLTIVANQSWYVENIPNIILFAVCLVIALIIIIGGAVLILYALDN